MQRLGKNHGGYHGETIPIDAILRDIVEVAAHHGWQTDTLPVSAAVKLPVLQRSPRIPQRRVYLSSGIHGDEPAGPLAMRQLLAENRWPGDLALWCCPCLNPGGFRLNRRENEAGVDLNRDYRQPQTAAVQAHTGWLQQQPAFDFALCLHEDWESHGFYVYELNPEQQKPIADQIIAAVAPVCPIDRSPLIEGREARDGIIRPQLNPEQRPDWPEAFYLIQHKTRLSCTLEAPSDWPLATRVAALVAGVRAALAAAG